MDTKILTNRLRLFAKKYQTPPYGREVEGTAELLDAATDKMERLAAYEATGIEPESILQLKKILEIFNCSANDPAELKQLLVKLQNLADAEREGRLVQYVPGDTVYDRFGMAWTVKTAEIHRFDGPLRYLYRCGHPGTDDYCALYSDEILTREEAEAALEAQKSGGENV